MKKLLLILLVMFPVLVFTKTEDLYPFSKPEQESRFNQLLTELRCMVCQNENLAESNAPLAIDLKNQVYDLVQNGEENKAIKEYLVARYGDFILYRTPIQKNTALLWLAPIILLVIGLVVFAVVLRSQP